MLSSQKISVETQTEQSGEPDINTLLIERGINAPAELIELIVQVVKKVPSLNEATIVNLANHLNITMFGSEISDKVTKTPGRKIYNLHPYRKAGSGAVCMATYTDDLNVAACAKRELQEEAGLSELEPEFLMEQSNYPDTNPDLHSINLSYLFHDSSKNLPPETKAVLFRGRGEQLF